MNKEQFLCYFKKKENTFEKNEDITITHVITCTMKETTNAKLRFAADEINKSASRPKTYQKQISKNMKKEVAKYVLIFGTSLGI